MLLGYVATESAETAVRQSEQHLHVRVSTSILLVISFLLFLGIILYHIHLKVKPNFDVKKYYRKYKNVLHSKIFSKSASTGDESFVSVPSDSGGLQLNEQYRETLLESNFHEFIDDN